MVSFQCAEKQAILQTYEWKLWRQTRNDSVSFEGKGKGWTEESDQQTTTKRHGMQEKMPYKSNIYLGIKIFMWAHPTY